MWLSPGVTLAPWRGLGWRAGTTTAAIGPLVAGVIHPARKEDIGMIMLYLHVILGYRYKVNNHGYGPHPHI